MKIKLRYIFLMLLCILPFTKVGALSKSDVFSTTPKKGYRCYVVCQTGACETKMVLYTNRDMSIASTYKVEITRDGTREIPSDTNAGLNLFANNIQYPDENKGVFHNISQYYSHALEGRFDFQNKTNIKGQVEEIQKAIKGRYGNDYDSIIKRFSGYSDNADIDSFSCIIAAETYDVVINNGGQLYSDGQYKYVYEEDYTKGVNGVYNISAFDQEKWPNLNKWLLLEGAGFYTVKQSLADGNGTIGSFIRTEDEDILEVPKITDTNNATMKEILSKRNSLNSKERTAVELLINNINSASGSLTHEKLIEFMGCVKVNHNLEEVEKKCENESKEILKHSLGTGFSLVSPIQGTTPAEAVALSKAKEKWAECLRSNGYTYDNACDVGLTLGVMPQLNNSSEAQQAAIDTYVNNGIYLFNKAAFELMASGTSISCYDIRYATYVWRAICILAPFLLIIFGSLDFIKSIMAADEKAQKEARKKLPKRIIAFIILLILPVILRIIFSMGQYNSNNLGLLKCVVTFDTTSTDPVNTSNSANTPKKKKYCENYSGKSCPKMDEYGNFCIQGIEAGTTSTLTCKKTGETGKHCTMYAMGSCPEEDDFGKECTLIKKEESSTPVCDYK